MYIAFYVADKGNFVDFVIDLWTRRYGYSHCEFLFSDGMCFSASPRENKVRFTRISNIYGDHWVLYKIPDMTPEKEAKLRERAKEFDGRRYDWVGIFFHEFLPFNRDSKGKFYCSEIIAYLLGFDDYKISPNKLAKKLGLPRK